MQLFAPLARLPHGWAKDVRLQIDGDGLLTSVAPDAVPDGAQVLSGPVIPAIPNLHSHAFQRGMAGLGEKRTADGDDFWSWREIMYRFLDRIGPDEAEALATHLYVEMVEAGYSRVAEFHYLHNDPAGRPYADRLEMARAHVRAARTAGIALTLVPVLYTHSTFGGGAPTHGQRRFVQSTQAYLQMLDALGTEAGEGGFDLAASVHSLRAVTPGQISEVLAAVPPDMPLHIHVAEQTKEVDDCLAWSGERPVEWLLNHVGLDDRWRLVHATHMTPDEATGAANSGAVAVLCPTTEGNLGDGFFQADAWTAAGGAVGIGTDSHVTMDPREELRWFEYGRRLNRRQRGVAATASQPHPGAALWLACAQADDRGGGAASGPLQVGKRADFLVLDEDHLSFAGRSGDALLDSLVFVSTPGRPPISETWVGGRQLTSDGRHPLREQTARAYAAALSAIVSE